MDSWDHSMTQFMGFPEKQMTEIDGRGKKSAATFTVTKFWHLWLNILCLWIVHFFTGVRDFCYAHFALQFLPCQPAKLRMQHKRIKSIHLHVPWMLPVTLRVNMNVSVSLFMLLLMCSALFARLRVPLLSGSS